MNSIAMAMGLWVNIVSQCWLEKQVLLVTIHLSDTCTREEDSEILNIYQQVGMKFGSGIIRIRIAPNLKIPSELEGAGSKTWRKISGRINSFGKNPHPLETNIYIGSGIHVIVFWLNNTIHYFMNDHNSFWVKNKNKYNSQ